MSVSKRLSQVYGTSPELPFDESSRIVIMSDCHRGVGNWGDNFMRNQTLFFSALEYYNSRNFTYIELGDGDELWENKKLSDVIQAHSDAFWLMSKFYADRRLHLIFGNHDMVKKEEGVVRENLSSYSDRNRGLWFPLFPGIQVHEGMILRERGTENKIFLVHGHQGDLLNDRMWRLARFLCRYLWRPLELIGVHDLTSAAKNYQKQRSVEKRLAQWARDENQMMICGHTHRPAFPAPGEAPYFNDGCGVHPRCITGIEIVYGMISLVKWSVKTRTDGTLCVGRDVLAGPAKLEEYLQAEAS